MLKLSCLLVTLLLWTGSASGQGTVMFVWHGDSNFFQASFQVYSYELASGTNFSSDLFLGSISVTNPAGGTYHGDSVRYGSGSFIPWSLNFVLMDAQRNTEVVIIGGGSSSHRTAGIMWERPLDSPDHLWEENGYWSAFSIPEPSIAALVACGAGCLVLAARLDRKEPRVKGLT